MPRFAPVKPPADPVHAAIAELQRRNNDALRLFRPMETQLSAIRTKASEILVRGGNRSGKSVLGAAIVASAARGKPLLDLAGNELPAFSPTGRPLLIWVIGKGEDHLGDTLYRLLFKRGQFPIFKREDGVICGARNYRERKIGEDQKLVAPAFIPEEEIQSMSFSKAGSEVFDRCTLTNGTIVCAYNSSGEVKMGDPVDLIWIDEDIVYPQYVGEWQARLSDRKGRLLWTAWPWADNHALRQISRRAESQQHLDNPDVFELKLSFADNPFIDEDEKRKRVDGWRESGTSEVESRVHGEWADGGRLMFPNFSLTVHGCPREGVSHRDPLETFLAEKNWTPPDHWTRYLTMDPGFSTTSIGLWAVPPPDEFPGLKLRYDELYLHNCGNADAVANAVKGRVEGQQLEAMIIDVHFAKQHVTGIGKTYLQIFADAFEKAGIRCNQTGSSFMYSSSEIIPGLAAFRQWLATGPNGMSQFRVVQQRCSEWVREAQMYRKQFAKDEAQDKPATGQSDHAMDETRYAAMNGLPYVAPRHNVAKFGTAYQAFTTFWNKPKAPDDDELKVTIGVGSQRKSA